MSRNVTQGCGFGCNSGTMRAVEKGLQFRRVVGYSNSLVAGGT